MSSTLPNNPTCWETLTASCANAQEAVIVAPYIKEQPLTLVLNSIAPDASITCVSRWTPHDIQAGTTDLACRSLVLGRNGTFLLHNRLHAKYYRFDSNVLVGSANLTNAGMSIYGNGNVEILCPPPADFDAERFERLLLLKAHRVSDAEFDAWNQIILTIQSGTPLERQDTAESFDGWKPITRNPDYLWLAYQQRGVEIPTAEQREIAIREVGILAIPSGLTKEQFNDWVRLSLQASPFIESVLATASQTDEDAYNTISQEWNITKSEAERSRTTALIWINTFGLSP